MCHHPHHRHKNSPPPVSMKPNTRSSSTKNKRKPTTTSVSLKPACKTRSKRRKPKYLSLNSKLNPQKNSRSSKKKIKMHQQLTLFPLHPEHLVEDGKDDMHDHEHEDNNVVASFLFDSATDTSTTLNGLLTSTTSGQESPAVSPLSLTFAYSEDQGQGGDSNGLVRTAMRCKQRDASEEKWVSYNEVVENKIKEEEVMSSSCIDDHDHDDVDEGAWCMKPVQMQKKKKKKLLALKLDYQEILNAWSDKGPLYIDGESPQTVPDLHDATVPMDAWSNVGNLWSVPEITSNDGSSNNVSDEVGGKEGWKREHREASVLRYKEKRQNRLFSKRIRYEVRKLNAEKRPRMKGRFVKRSSEE